MSNRPPWVRGRSASLLLGTIFLLSCSDDEPTDDGNGSDRVVVPLEGAVSNLQVFADQTSEFVFTLQLPPEYKNVQAVTLDAEGSARHVDLIGISLKSLIRESLDDPSILLGGHGATATIRVGNDPATVCSEGILYGPFQVSHTTSTEVTPETVDADAPTIEIINAGMIAMCVSITPTIDATFSMDNVELDVTDGSCGSPANFAGAWSGTYECGNSCGGPFGGDIDITVNQNGAAASYSDGDATFSGTVCGNRFRFERVTAGEIERGTLTLDDANHATKRSTWRSTTPPYCSGNCVDVLTRVSN